MMDSQSKHSNGQLVVILWNLLIALYAFFSEFTIFNWF